MMPEMDGFELGYILNMDHCDYITYSISTRFELPM